MNSDHTSLRRVLTQRVMGVQLLSMLAAVLLWVLIFWDVQPAPGDSVADLMLEVRSAIRPQADGSLELAPTPAWQAFRQTHPTIAVAAAAQARVLAGSDGWLADAVFAAPIQYDIGTFTCNDPSGQPMVGELQTVRTAYGDVRVAIAGLPASTRHDVVITFADASEIEISEAGLLWLPILLPLALGTFVAVPLAVRRAFRPVDRASRIAQQIGPGARGLRIPPAGVPAEVQPLVQAVNAGLDRLEAQLDARQRFAANAAHELRTPITILRARIETLPPGHVTTLLRDDINRLARVAEGLLQLTRLERRDEPLATAALDLAALVREVIAELAPLALDRGRVLELTAAGPVRVLGHADFLRAAVVNLVDNALRFTPVGSCVEVAVAVVGAQAEVAVADHGPGVPADQRVVIFEPFWRGATQSDGHAAGSGLGLAIVRETAAAHRGEVSVTDTPGGGATFRLRLPIA